MWTSRELKIKARKVLSDGAFGKCLVAVLICNMFSMVFTRFTAISPDIEIIYEPGAMEKLTSAILNKPFMFFGMLGSVIIISLIIGLFVNNPLNIGLTRFFTESARGNTSFKEIIFFFPKGFSAYLNIVKVQFIKTLFLFLWAMAGVIPVCVLVALISSIAVSDSAVIAMLILAYILLILSLIPMIIKSYQYMMVDYIQADNPELSWREVFKKSKSLSKGQIYRMFKLNISFIGWVLIGTMLCGVGVMLVVPYINMTFAMLYLELDYNSKGEFSE